MSQKLIFAAIALAFLFPLVGASITCIEALEKMRIYVEQDESITNIFDQPLFYEMKNYCVISYPSTIKDSKNFFVVESQDGNIIKDEKLLNGIFILSFKNDIIQRTYSEKWLPANDLTSLSQGLISSLNDIKEKKDFLKSELAQKYKSGLYPPFDSIDSALANFEKKMNKIGNDFDYFNTQYSNFQSDFSSATLEKAFIGLNNSIADLQEIAKMSERLQNSLDDYKSSLNSFKNMTEEDRLNTKTNIDGLKIIGDQNAIDSSFKPKVEIAAKKFAYYSDRLWIFSNDAVKFSEFRMAKKEAQIAYLDLQKDASKNIDTLMQASRLEAYKQCTNIKQTDIQYITITWSEIKKTMNPNNLNAKTEDYAKIPDKAAALGGKVDDFVKKIAFCENSGTTSSSSSSSGSPTKVNTEPDYLLPIAIILLIAIIGYEIYKRIRKKMEDDSQEEENESESVKRLKRMPNFK